MTYPPFPPQPPDEYPVMPDSSLSHFRNLHYTPLGITATFPLVVTIENHGLQNGQAIRATKFVTLPFAAATGMQQLNGRLFTVEQATADTFQLYGQNGLPIDGRNYTPWIQGGQFTLVGPDIPVENPSPPPPPGNPPFPPA